MKKTILTLSMLTLMPVTSITGSIIDEMGAQMERDKGLLRNAPKPNPRPSKQEARRCAGIIVTLVNDIKSHIESRGFDAAYGSLEEAQITSLGAVPAEYFFWDARKQRMRLSDAFFGRHHTKEQQLSIDILIFLGLSKLELNLEDFDLQQLAEKYLFSRYQVKETMLGELVEKDFLTPAELVGLATRFGLPNFGRYFL